MRRTDVVGTLLGLGLLVAVPVALSGPQPGQRTDSGTEMRAALDMFLELGPVKGESRDEGSR